VKKGRLKGTRASRNAERERQVKELKARKLEILRKQSDFRAKNRLLFFDTPPNPGPNPKQAQILEAFLHPHFKTFGMSGGNRFGKTALNTLIALSVLDGSYPWDDYHSRKGQKTSLLHLFPHNRARKVRYIGQGWHDHIKAVVIPEIEKWWPDIWPVERHGNGIITDTFWKRLDNGSTLEIMSNNQRSKEHEGWSGDVTLYDEPCRKEIYIANARGLVDRRGRELFAATLLDEPWIDREIIKKVDKNGRPDKTVFWVTGSSYDNAGYGISREGIQEFEAKLTEDEIQARIHGIPQYMQGLIYPQFNRKTHLVEQFMVPTNWMVDIAIDVHPRECQAVLFVATDDRNERYVCDEIWEYGDGTQIAEAIVRKVNRNAYRVNRIVIDPLSKGDSNSPETTYNKVFKVLARNDLPLETATKEKDIRLNGILETKTHLLGPNKKPSLFFMDSCVRTLYEIEGYMWEMKQGKPTGKPSDIDDHMMENLSRILLLNTHYIDPEEEFDTYYNKAANYDSGRNSVTGY